MNAYPAHSAGYDFVAFIEKVKHMDFLDIVAAAEKEAAEVEASSYRVKGAVRRRRMGSSHYVDQLGAFLFWMRHGVRPLDASEEDFQLYRIVAERLVAKGHFKESVLEIFNRPRPPQDTRT